MLIFSAHKTPLYFESLRSNSALLFCTCFVRARIKLRLGLLNIPGPSRVLLHLSELAILAKYRGKPVKDSTSSGSGLFYLTLLYLRPCPCACAVVTSAGSCICRTRAPDRDHSASAGACLVTSPALIPHLVPDFGREFPLEETWSNIHTLICC